MSDLSSFSPKAAQSTVKNESWQSASWRQVLKRAMEQSTWFGHHPSRVEAIQPNDMPRHFSPNQKSLIVIACFAIFGVIVAIGIIRYLDLPVPAKSKSAIAAGKSLLGLTPSAKPKPAPGKPIVAATEIHPPKALLNPPPQQQQPSAALVPQTPAVNPMASATASPMPQILPSQPLASATLTHTALVYQARHDKHFGGSCSGQLTLSAAGLNFHCDDDPSESVQVALNQIGTVDDNGIATLSGKKYHFSIPGMSKNSEQTLFVNWLHQVR
jgi:hypothetical protein